MTGGGGEADPQGAKQQQTSRSCQAPWGGAVAGLASFPPRDVNTTVMELLIMVYACKTSCAKSIIGVVPYFPYSKQCKMRKRGSIVSKLLASMMCKAGEELGAGASFALTRLGCPGHACPQPPWGRWALPPGGGETFCPELGRGGLTELPGGDGQARFVSGEGLGLSCVSQPQLFKQALGRSREASGLLTFWAVLRKRNKRRCGENAGIYPLAMG